MQFISIIIYFTWSIILSVVVVNKQVNALNLCERNNTQEPKFHLTRRCQRSSKTIIDLDYFINVAKCEEFARSRKGLAFNYKLLNRGEINLFDVNIGNEKGKNVTELQIHTSEIFNCEVLNCPEYGNWSSIINDTRYDYYSLYATIPELINLNCIPTIGMFHYNISKNGNYFVGKNYCQQIGGSLAHILSESRSVLLTKYLKEYFNEFDIHKSFVSAFIGLYEMLDKKGKFLTSKNESIDCFLYRAWAPGHPIKLNNKRGCVALTMENSWKIYDCYKKMPFICEIHTSVIKNITTSTIQLTEKCSIH